jgi:pimeloyl-ACP methyl ester carboxylesterase
MAESDAAGFISRFYTSADGLKLHYRDYAGPAGARLTIICLPGLTRNARDYEDLAPHLARRYRVLCPEFRGRGLSAYASDPSTYVPQVYLRDTVRLFAAAGVRRAAIVGTSLGGMVGVLLAAAMPAKVLGLVINDIGPRIEPTGINRIAGYVGKSAPVTNWDEAAAAIKRLDGEIYPEYGPADWLRMAHRRFVQNSDGSFRPDYDFAIAKPFAGGGGTPDLWPFFARLKTVPTLLFRGANSDLLSRETVTRLASMLPDMRAIEVPNRGHTPSLSEPESLAAIDDFLAHLSPRMSLMNAAMRSAGALLFLARLKRSGAI